MRYVLARISNENDEEAYRFYMAEGIKIIGYNTAGLHQEGKALTRSFIDIMNPIVETRTSDEIKNNIVSKLESKEDN